MVNAHISSHTTNFLTNYVLARLKVNCSRIIKCSYLVILCTQEQFFGNELKFV